MDIIQELKIAEREAEERLKIAKQEASMRVLHKKQELDHMMDSKEMDMYNDFEMYKNEQNKHSQEVINTKIKALEAQHKTMKSDDSLEKKLTDTMYNYCISLFKA